MAYANIPGMSLHVKDGGLLVSVPTGSLTDTVLIIGNAVDGPTGRALKVTASTAEKIYGPLVYDDNVYLPPASRPNDTGKYNGNNLLKAYNEVTAGGCTDVMFMRVGGTQATSAAASAALGMTLSSVYPGSVYNTVIGTSPASTSGLYAKLTVTSTASGTGNITQATLQIMQRSLGKGYNKTYTIVDKTNGRSICKTKEDFILEVNGDTANRTITLAMTGGSYTDYVASSFSVTASGTKETLLTLSGGTDGTRQDGTYSADSYWLPSTDEDGIETFTTSTSAAPGAINGLARLYHELMAAETGPFDKLLMIEPDIVYLPCLYFDDNVSDTPLVVQLSAGIEFAAALHRATSYNYPMVGVMGQNPLTKIDRLSISQAVSRLITNEMGTDYFNSGYFVSCTSSNGTQFAFVDEDTNDVIDAGRYVQVVAGPDVVLYNDDLGSYIETPAGVYAGLLSTVPPNRAVSNMTLPGIKGLLYEYTYQQINKLSGGQPWDDMENTSGDGGSYIVLRKNALGNIIVNLDNTCAERSSDYANYQVLYIVNLAASGIKRISTNYLGLASSLATRLALKNEIKSFLDALAETGAIAGGEDVGYSFSVGADTYDQVLGRVVIKLQLRPCLQIKTISVTINVVPPTGS